MQVLNYNDFTNIQDDKKTIMFGCTCVKKDNIMCLKHKCFTNYYI